MSYPEEAWKRLGDYLTERRVLINPAYRNRLKFAADTGLNERLVSDLERGRRTSYRDTTLQAVEVAYQLRPGGLQDILMGGVPGPVEPVMRASPTEPEAHSPPAPGTRVGRYDERHLEVTVAVDRQATPEEVLKDLTPEELAMVTQLQALKYPPEAVIGAVLLVRRAVLLVRPTEALGADTDTGEARKRA